MESFDSLDKESIDRLDHIFVVGILLHQSRRFSLHMHDHYLALPLFGETHHARIFERGDVIDEAKSTIQTELCDARIVGVDTEFHPLKETRFLNRFGDGSDAF